MMVWSVIAELAMMSISCSTGARVVPVQVYWPHACASSQKVALADSCLHMVGRTFKVSPWCRCTCGQLLKRCKACSCSVWSISMECMHAKPASRANCTAAPSLVPVSMKVLCTCNWSKSGGKVLRFTQLFRHLGLAALQSKYWVLTYKEFLETLQPRLVHPDPLFWNSYPVGGFIDATEEEPCTNQEK